MVKQASKIKAAIDEFLKELQAYYAERHGLYIKTSRPKVIHHPGVGWLLVRGENAPERLGRKTEDVIAHYEHFTRKYREKRENYVNSRNHAKNEQATTYINDSDPISVPYVPYVPDLPPGEIMPDGDGRLNQDWQDIPLKQANSLDLDDLPPAPENVRR